MTVDLDALEALAKAADDWGGWAIWPDLTEGGFIHVGNEDGVIPEGQIATPDDAEPNLIAKAYTPEIAEFIAAADPSTILALVAKLRQERERKKPPLIELLTLRSAVEQFDTGFPCDGGCSWNDGPEETCSRHGRKPSDLWNLLDEARAALSRAEETIARFRQEAQEIPGVATPNKNWARYILDDYDYDKQKGQADD